MSRPRIVAYPFLAALYSVLALAAKNAAEVSPRDLLTPTVIALSVAAVAWVIGRLITRDRYFGGALAFVIVVWVAWYGYFDRLLVSNSVLQPIASPRYAAPLILLLLAAVPICVAWRRPRLLQPLSRFLHLSTTILLVFPVVVLMRSWVRTERAMDRPNIRSTTESASRSLLVGQQRPDLYLIILDKFTGSRSLEANYGYDNHPFEDSLRRRGFYVPRNPHSNYVHTHLALASILNWQLLTARPPQLTAADGALGLDYAAIEDNRTWRFMRGLGYRFVFFPSAYPATAKNRYADLQLPSPSAVVGEFDAVWVRKTLLLPIGRWWCRNGCRNGGFPYSPASASLMDWKFAQLGQMPDSAGPLFVFAHFALPHEPYVFNADCSQRDPYWPEADSGAEEAQVKKAYVDQIKCVDQKVIHLISQLLSNSSSPPIIILQADHGHGRLGRTFGTLSDAGPERAAERTDIFAAYFLPGHPADVVYDSITPVNILPRILDHYFDAGIPSQPDATYWSSWDEPFKFTRIR